MNTTSTPAPNPLTLLYTLERDGVHRTRVSNVGNFLMAQLRAADGGQISIASYAPGEPMGYIDAPRLDISSAEMAALDDFLGTTRTWYHFFTRGHSHKLHLITEHFLSLVVKHNLARSCGSAIMTLLKEGLVFSFEEINFGDPETGSAETTRNFFLVCQDERQKMMVKVTSPDPD